MESQEELWVVSCLQHAPFEINVELIDVFIIYQTKRTTIIYKSSF